MLLSHLTVTYKINKKSISHEFSAKLMNITGYKDYYGHRYNFKKNSVEEDQFGDIPTGEPDSNNKHWLNTYKTKDKQGSQWIHTVHPICLRGADYLSKDLNTNIGDGRDFTLIGLEQAPQRRLELFKQGQALGKPTKDWSLTSYPVEDTNQLDVQPAVMAPAESKVLEEIDPMQSNPENIRHQNLKSPSEPAESPDSKNLPEYAIWG
jgi:hypothetical protein